MILYEHYNEKQRQERADTPVSRRRTRGLEKVAAHSRCPGIHLGESLAPRRLQHVDEIYIFRVRDGKLTDATGVEDNLNRLRRLGLDCWHRKVIQELKVAIRSQSGARSYGNGRYQS